MGSLEGKLPKEEACHTPKRDVRGEKGLEVNPAGSSSPEPLRFSSVPAPEEDTAVTQPKFRLGSGRSLLFGQGGEGLPGRSGTMTRLRGSCSWGHCHTAE